ncbi:MAG: ergothioneine biosynthesis protein EgtB [Deltaproteobacteria bacterium]|nr:ergothioneine biosynthesis protein EgtB [Deltaproteobacteria bacterium]
MCASSLVTLARRYDTVRAHSVALCEPLAIEDYVVQPSADVSPPKWHLGHCTWFFETVILQAYLQGYQQFHPSYGFVFNSYYESQGERVVRSKRGDLSRPTVAEVLAYRAHVDAAMGRLLSQALSAEAHALIELGIQHEQQHQELLLTDIKYILGVNPLRPAYAPSGTHAITIDNEFAVERTIDTARWLASEGGLVSIGASATDDGFTFDNECPRHRVWLEPFEIRDTLITQGEFIEFIRDGGYRDPLLWLSEGWQWVCEGNTHPLYWSERDGVWEQYTLAGVVPVNLQAPVTHISYFEAAAYCEWAGQRLPTEAEWETMAGSFSWGQRWEWTQSAYAPYPGFVPAEGTVREYNGKFMVSQLVLRGASFATPSGHARVSYRNFFHPPLRWQYTGIRPVRTSRSTR